MNANYQSLIKKLYIFKGLSLSKQLKEIVNAE